MPNYRTKARKDKRDNFLANHYVSLFDYFYWLRIKANYKDVDFLDFDNDINATDAYKYVQEYAEATEKYAKALKVLIAEVKSRRGM